jgi:broad specificity phosphatase PhoE
VSTLYVIRHGQASFGAVDYDNLTDLGREQSLALGKWLQRLEIDAVYTGPRRRHRDTTRLMCEAYGAIPESIEVAGLDEYPAEVIMRRALAGGDVPAEPGTFQAAFEKIMHGWVRGDHDHHPDVEPFRTFAARVADALRRIMADTGRGKTIVAVTSAGPMSIALQMTLEVGDAVALRTSWVVANTAITEIKFRDDEVTLVAFNGTPHLPERRLITYR